MSQAKKPKVKVVEKDAKGRDIIMLDMGTDEKKQEKDLEKKYNAFVAKPDMKYWKRAKESLPPNEAKAYALFKTMYDNKMWSMFPDAEIDSAHIKFLGKVSSFHLPQRSCSTHKGLAEWGVGGRPEHPAHAGAGSQPREQVLRRVGRPLAPEAASGSGRRLSGQLPQREPADQAPSGHEGEGEQFRQPAPSRNLRHPWIQVDHASEWRALVSEPPPASCRDESVRFCRLTPELYTMYRPEGSVNDESQWKIVEIWSPSSIRMRWVDITEPSSALVDLIEKAELRLDGDGNNVGHGYKW